MSAAGPITRGNAGLVPAPRWSVVRLAGLDPALTAGLPVIRAWVAVGPPLNCSGASSGSVPAGRLLEPVSVAPVWFLTRLKLAVAAPSKSGLVGAVLLATITLSK